MKTLTQKLLDIDNTLARQMLTNNKIDLNVAGEVKKGIEQDLQELVDRYALYVNNLVDNKE